jgi:Ca2+-binding RTX toxin-like protein
LTTGNDSFVDNSGVGNIIQGSLGNDAINGSTGNDSIQAGAGNDTINGGDGSDRMEGGSGNDTFVFVKGQVSNGGAGTLDHIIDFQGAGGYNAVQDFIRFIGFGDGSTFTLANLTSGKNAAIYNLFDTADSSTVKIMIQFADANYTGTTQLVGAAKGSFVAAADFGWL